MRNTRGHALQARSSGRDAPRSLVTKADSHIQDTTLLLLLLLVTCM